jgi:uncharacterized protein (TIGR03435 family)
MNIAKIGLGVVLSAATLFGQDPPRPSFEVATIRPAPPTPPQGVAVGVHIDGAQFHATFMTLRDYMGMAYRLKLYQISGPDWTGSERFDVSATLPDGSLPAQLPNMMQSLLEERFQLKMHRRKRTSPFTLSSLRKAAYK